MNLKKICTTSVFTVLTFSTATDAALGPIPIYLNTEYRTSSPVIDSIASTLTFSEEDIKSTGAGTFLEFLDSVPSVNLFNTQGNIPAVFMRGGDSYHTLVLVDGISINDISGNKGAVEYGLISVPLNDIEKIEIVKGSGSVLYGSSAISGVIAITTKKGADGKNASVSFRYGSNNSKTYSLSVNEGSKDGFVRFTHNKYSSDGINARTDDTSNEKDSLSNQATQIKAGNEHFDITYLVTNNKTEYDAWNGANTEDLGDKDLTKLSFNINNKFSKEWKYKILFAQTETHRNSGVNAATIGNKYKSTALTMLNYIRSNDALLNVGLSKFDDENITKSHKLSSSEIFINWQKNIFDLDVNTGLRYINHSDFGNKIIYNLGAAKYINNDIKLTSNFGTTFKTPTLVQIIGTGDAWYQPNPNIKPETSKNIELGIEKKYELGSSGIKIFQNKTNNYFNYRDSMYFNEDSYKATGLELFGDINIYGYNVSFDHTYSKSIKNNIVTQQKRPKNITNLALNKQYAKFNSRAQVVRKSSSTDQNANNPMNGYTLVNLSTKYNLSDNINALLSINNVFDKDYKTADVYGSTHTFNNPGRRVTIGLDYSF